MAGHLARRRVDRRLCPSPDGSDGRIGGCSSHGPRARVWCVFQPHQASRTARLFEEFAASLQNADKVLVADIFRAREGDPQPGEVTAADLARRAAGTGRRGLARHMRQRDRRNAGNPVGPRRRIGYSRGWRRGKIAAEGGGLTKFGQCLEDDASCDFTTSRGYLWV